MTPPARWIAITSMSRRTLPSSIKLLHSLEDSAIEYVYHLPNLADRQLMVSCPGIVFVYGLTGDRDKTWTAQDTSDSLLLSSFRSPASSHSDMMHMWPIGES
jgi:hypothetical protein